MESTGLSFSSLIKPFIGNLLPSLNTQEAVVTGDGVTVPVHIRFKDLPPEHRPSSHEPSFSASWKRDVAPDFLDRSIERWRKQAIDSSRNRPFTDPNEAGPLRVGALYGRENFGTVGIDWWPRRSRSPFAA